MYRFTIFGGIAALLVLTLFRFRFSALTHLPFYHIMASECVTVLPLLPFYRACRIYHFKHFSHRAESTVLPFPFSIFAPLQVSPFYRFSAPAAVTIFTRLGPHAGFTILPLWPPRRLCHFPNLPFLCHESTKL